MKADKSQLVICLLYTVFLIVNAEKVSPYFGKSDIILCIDLCEYITGK